MESSKTESLTLTPLNLLITLCTKSMNILEWATAKIWELINHQQIKMLDPLVRDNARKFIAAAQEHGIVLHVISAKKSQSKQTKFYAQGHSAPFKIIVNELGYGTTNNFGLAIDVVPYMNGHANWNANWRLISDIGKDFGWVWAGDILNCNNNPHF